MDKVVYTAEAHVTGGRGGGRGRTDDGVLDVELRLPKELGGEGGATNPEQLLAVGWAACFESVLTMLASGRGLDAADVAIDSRVALVAAGGGEFRLAAALDVTLPSIAGSAAADLVHATHVRCPYSKATRGNIDVAIAVNGAPVAV